MFGDEGRPHTFIGAPKPENFEAMSAAWNNPAAFRIEVAKYHAQVRDFFAERGGYPQGAPADVWGD